MSDPTRGGQAGKATDTFQLMMRRLKKRKDTSALSPDAATDAELHQGGEMSDASLAAISEALNAEGARKDIEARDGGDNLAMTQLARQKAALAKFRAARKQDDAR